jgi:predicted phage gp36 major capsid-like protein
MFATLRANLLATVLGLAAVIFAVIAIVQSVEINGFLWWDGLKEKNERLEADNKELIDGAEEAKRLNEQQIQRIERDQEKVNETRLADLTARLERLRSELRSKAAPRNPGSSRKRRAARPANFVDRAAA